MTHIGIMQGRLVPPTDNRFQCFPRERWADEFPLAAQAGLDCIEWIYDLYGADVNPIATEGGLESLKRLSEKHGVKVFSICADYFMDKPLVRAGPKEVDERLTKLFWLLDQGHSLGINRIVIPFVDASRIETQAEFENVAALLQLIIQKARITGIEIHLETSLNPERFAELLGSLQDPLLKANYDSGNSSSLGYDPRQEFAAYGSRIGSVHIKDRLLGAGTVPLGTGNADFTALGEVLKKVNYQGDFILQAARGVNGDEVAWARHNREFVIQHFCQDIDRG